MPVQTAEPQPAALLLAQGAARADTSQTGLRHSAAVDWVRSHFYRPLLALGRRILGGTVLLGEPVALAEDPTLADRTCTLHPARTLNFGLPALDPFLRSCQYIVDGRLARSAIFVCEIPQARFYPRLGLVFDRSFRPIVDSILDLARYHNFRRLLRPLRLTRYPGTISSVQHIFHHNHWHWTFDSLAQIHSLELYQQGQPLRLILPDLLPPAHREHLELLLPANFSVEYVAAEQWIAADRFVLPSYVSGRANALLPPDYYRFLRERVFAGLNIAKPAHAQARYYLSRSRAAHRRVTNEPEVLALLERYGFEPLWMEDLTLAQQVAHMRAAQVVVAPHGAALGSILYADALELCVLYPEAAPAGYFYTLAHGLGHRHFQVNASLREDDDFPVDLAALDSILAHQMRLEPRPAPNT